MTTITRESAEIKSFITGFLSDPAHDNQSSNSLLADVFRIALASLEAEPIAWTDDEELRDVERIGCGYILPCPPDKYADPRRVIPLYRYPPAPVAPDGWISCSERMPNDAQWCVVDTEGGYYVQCWSEGQGWLGDDINLSNCDVIRWMPIQEPKQEVE